MLNADQGTHFSLTVSEGNNQISFKTCIPLGTWLAQAIQGHQRHRVIDAKAGADLGDIVAPGTLEDADKDRRQPNCGSAQLRLRTYHGNQRHRGDAQRLGPTNNGFDISAQRIDRLMLADAGLTRAHGEGTKTVPHLMGAMPRSAASWRTDGSLVPSAIPPKANV